MSRYSVNLEFKRPNGNKGNKWFTVHADTDSEAKQVALEQARSENPDYQWSAKGLRKVS